MAKKIFLYCKPTGFNWFVLPGLESHLAKIGLEAKNLTIEISRYPATIQYDSLEEALTDVRANGEPRRYNIMFSDSGFKAFWLNRSSYLDGGEFLHLHLDGVGSIEDARALADLLGLKLDSTPATKSNLEKKGFIAHRFDDTGTELADKLARFLSLLNFEVSTGRAFAPGSVSGKVKTRMEQQSIVFAILTPGDDPTWLTQESLLGSLGKPLFLLKEKDYSFKPGLLGDHEYIPFVSAAIEATFIPVLEGIRELGFKL